MKITGKGQRINGMELHLRSLNTRFQCFVEPFPYADWTDLSEPNVAVITFEDSREIDSLIRMLEEFKVKNAQYCGR